MWAERQALLVCWSPGPPLRAASAAGSLVYVNSSGSTLGAVTGNWSCGKAMAGRVLLFLLFDGFKFLYYVYLLPINDKNTNSYSVLDSGLMDPLFLQ